jgi:hypothetical protein
MGIKDDRDALFEENLEMCEQVTQIDIFKYHELFNSRCPRNLSKIKSG